MKASTQELDKLIFFIVDNMNRGSRLITSSDQKYEVSLLNLQAGKFAQCYLPEFASIVINFSHIIHHLLRVVCQQAKRPFPHRHSIQQRNIS